MYTVRGWNEFYQGWLACLLQQPLEPGNSDDHEAWALGWETAEETGPGAFMALAQEIHLGHIIVESREIPNA